MCIKPLLPNTYTSLLIVDDEKKIRDSLCLILENSDHKVFTAATASEALALLTSQSIQLILLDLNMPGLSGHSILQYIAQNKLNTQVIVVSGRAEFSEAKRTLCFDFVNDFIKKPYDVHELLNAINRSKRIIQLNFEKSQMQEQLKRSEELHRFFVEQSPDVIFLLDANGHFSLINTTAHTILGYEPIELERQHYSLLVDNADLVKASDLFHINHLDLQKTKTCELRLNRKCGETIYVEIKAIAVDLAFIPFLDIDEITTGYGIYGSIRDINERKLAEKSIQKLNLAMENSPILIVITNHDGVIEYVSQKITETTGYTLEEVIGLNPKIFSSGETSKQVYDELWTTITSGRIWNGILKNKKKNGEFYWCKQSIAPMIDCHGMITNYVAIQEDVTEAFMLTEKLSYQASHDPLTQLINRNEFDRRLERAVWSAQKKGYEHALCYLDLDQFKVVNDTCSHMAGDELLRQISAQLIKILREKDTLARIGGDEFAIIMEHCSLEQAECVTKKIHQLVEHFQFQWEEKSFRVGVSIGLVIIKHDSLGPETYLKRADMACYLAKDAGRNRTHIYNDDDQALIQHHGEMNWIARINQALEEDSFCLYAQSIIPLSGNGGEHYEILVRKRNNDEIILPGAFMPAAERFQLSPKIDRWVISKVFDYFNHHPERLKCLAICSINLSGLSLNDPGLCAFIEQKLQHSRLPASKICFEITETATIANLSMATHFIASLKAHGCKFSLDDFGSGLSSFGYLKNLEVDFLKIDGYFVRDIEHNSVGLAIVKSINDIGHVMGKKTIAEFVENQQILDILCGIKVDYVQGYQMGIPKLLQ